MGVANSDSVGVQDANRQVRRPAELTLGGANSGSEGAQPKDRHVRRPAPQAEK
jgi:hypothetical protein